MLVCTQNSFSECRNDVLASNPFSELHKKCGRSFVHLLAPEDTTEYSDKGPSQTQVYNRNNINGLMKIAFWMAISISIALIMGQLS